MSSPATTVDVQNTALGGSARWSLAALSLSMLLPSLATSIANVGLPELVEAFGAPFEAVQWVVVAYLLAMTALVVSAGRLGDIIGRRRLMLAGLALFTAASLGCAVAPSLAGLIVGRSLQGAGAAVVMALTMALVGEVTPKARTGAAMGLLGTTSAIGTTLGPAFGGVLIAAFGWRSMFLINVPLGMIALILAIFTLPKDRRGKASGNRAFDTGGAILLAGALTAYALALTAKREGVGAYNLALLCVAGAAAALFVVVQGRIATPLLQLTIFRYRGLGASLGTNGLISTVMMSTLVVGPFYLSGALGLTTAAVGVAMAAGPFIAALAGVFAGALVDRVGASRMVVVGLAGMGFGLVVLIACLALGIAGYIAGIVVVTAHYALFQAANNTAIMAAAPADQRGAVSGLLGLSRNLGLITGASAMGAVFAFGAGPGPLSTATNDAVADGARLTFMVAIVLVAVSIGLAVRSAWSRRG